MTEETTPSSETSPIPVQFDFIKSSAYRLVHADGAWGGPTTQGYVYMALYAERPAIPQSIIGTVSSGETFQETRDERISRKAIIREVEVGVLMDIDTAIALRAWLDEKIRTMEQFGAVPRSAAKAQSSSPPLERADEAGRSEQDGLS